MENHSTVLRHLGRIGVKSTQVMKLMLVFLIVGTLQVSASVYSQNGKMNVNVNKMELSELLWQLQENSEIRFVYETEDLSGLEKVSVNIQNAEVHEVLDKVLENSELEYVIKDNVVIIKRSADVLASVQNQQQNDEVTITGQVVDEKGAGLPGATVSVQGKQVATMTDDKGRYSIKALKSDALLFTFIGYKSQIILIEDKEKIDVQLQPETETIDDVTVVAFGSQKKESVVSAITTVKADDLKSSNSDLTSSFAGKIAGVVGWQTGGAPASLTEDEMNTKFAIRGITSYASNANTDPLILLDGIEVSKLDLARIDPDDIESFNVMKDASATAMYGARGANGVIYVKTKKGTDGDVRTSFRYERIYSTPTDEIDVVSPVDYMRYYNKAEVYRGLDPSMVTYSSEKIENTGNPQYPSWVFPATDWYETMFKDYAVNNHYALNVRGGGRKVQYYGSLAYNIDNGMLATEPLNQFDVNVKNEQTKINLNVNVNLTKDSKLNINSFTTYDKYHGTGADVYNIYALAFAASPVDFAPVYPKDNEFTWPHIRFGGTIHQPIYDNPYATVHAGYMDRGRFSSVNQFEWIQSLESFVKGLEVRAKLAYQRSGYYQNTYSTKPAIYTLSSYSDPENFTLSARNYGSDDSKLTKLMEKSYSNIQSITDFQATILHTAAWDVHQTSFTGVFTTRNKEISGTGSGADWTSTLPYRNLGIALRGTYGLKDKYFAELSLGINGSERFAEGHRMGYFPAIGGAWILTNENFASSLSNWLHFAKFRVSYGMTGNDGVYYEQGNSMSRFLYLETIGEGSKIPIGASAGGQTPSLEVKTYPKINTKWETNEQLNLGLDLKLFKGIFEATIDAYRSVRHNIYANRYTIPSAIGLVTPPLDNYGSVLSKGIDFSGKVQHAFSNDFWIILNGTLTYSRATHLKAEQPEGTPEWQNVIGNDIFQQKVYIAEGLFQDQQEIDNAPVQSGDVQPGDIRYKDVNKDGKIDINDRVLAGHSVVPALTYGFNAFAHYKNWEFSLAFQGSGQRSLFLDAGKISPFSGALGKQAMLKQIADSHWAPDNQENTPFWPKLSTENMTKHNIEEQGLGSTYFMYEATFLRCKSIELAYYLKSEWLEKVKIKNFKIYARTNNPFVIRDFKLWDPELGGNGFAYPIQKTFSIGANFSF